MYAKEILEIFFFVTNRYTSKLSRTDELWKILNPNLIFEQILSPYYCIDKSLTAYFNKNCKFLVAIPSRCLYKLRRKK